MKVKMERFKHILSEKLTLYPSLTGILFLVNELRKNGKFYSIKEIALLIVIVLTFTLVVDLLSRRYIKNKIKAALIATLFIILNLFYQDFFRHLLLTNWSGKSTYVNHPAIFTFLLLIFLWLALTIIVLKTKKLDNVLNFYFNIVAISFLVVELTKWIFLPVPQIKLVDNEPFPVIESLSREQKPDIYYIILDAYTSSESLKKYWNYDNCFFEDSLKQLGFSVKKNIKTSYAITHFCLASYFNSSLLIADTTRRYQDWNLLKLIRINKLYDWLEANEYKSINYSPFDAFGSRKYLKAYYFDHFLGRTIWDAIALKLFNTLILSSRVSQANLRIFDKLNSVIKNDNDQPVFAYVHVMMPHKPYFYNENGVPYNNNESLTEKQKYLGQLKYTNKLIIRSVQYILNTSKTRPIIIIQGDHGYRELENLPKKEISDEAHSIFYAILTPYDIATPIIVNPENTFKMIINGINNKKNSRN